MHELWTVQFRTILRTNQTMLAKLTEKNTTFDNIQAMRYVNNTVNPFTHTKMTGWEGLPFNLAVNLVLFCTMIVTFSILRRLAWNKRSEELTRTQKGWLQFIYGDREPRFFQERQTLKESHKHDLKPGLIVPPSLLPTYIIRYRIDSDDEQDDLFDRKEFIARLPFDNWRVRSQKHRLELEDEDFERLGRKAEYIVHKNRFTKAISTESLIQVGFWILDLFLIQEKEILRNKGKDAVQYLVFQQYIICFLIFLTLISIAVILPINLQGTQMPPNKVFQRTTLSNLSVSSSWLWVHIFLSAVLFPIGQLTMAHFARTINVDEEQICKKTLFIRRIPNIKRTKQILAQFLTNRVKNVNITGIQFVYNIRNLRNLHREYNNVVNAKYFCEEYLVENNQHFEARPYFFGRFGGLLCCCYCCPKVRGLQYYTEKQKDLERRIEGCYKNCLLTPSGSLFITFEDEQMAKRIKSFIEEYRTSVPAWCIYGHFCCRFIDSMINIVTCKQDDEPYQLKNWVVNYAPYPDDINWKDIELDFHHLWSRRIFVHTIIFVMFFFVSTPAIILSTFDKFETSFDLGSKIANFSPALTAYLPSFLLMAGSAFLPFLIGWCCEILPYDTISDKNHSIMIKVFLFLVMMTVIYPSLGHKSGSAFLVTVFEGNRTTIHWNNVTTVTSSLFTNYILSSALVGTPFDLLRIPELLLYFCYSNFFSQTIAEYDSARRNVMFEFRFGILYSQILLIFFLSVTFSLACPLIVPCGLLYMIVRHVVDRYNIYYVYHPSRISVRVHSTAIKFFNLSLLAMQFQLWQFLFTEKASVTKSIIAFIAFLNGCILFFVQWFNYWDIGLPFFSRKTNPETRQEWCACSYAPRVLFELNTRGIVPSDAMSSGSFLSSGTAIHIT